MPTPLTRSPDNPDFARVVPVPALRRLARYEFEIAPEAAEAAAVAALLGAEAVRGMRLAGSIVPEGEGLRLEAVLGATVVQPCVVSLAPVTSRIDVPVRRRFLPPDPGSAPRPGAEIEIGSLEDDETEPLGARIDLGLLAIEALALALPDYPRAEGAALPPAAGAPEPAPAAPFAALAALRRPPGGGR